MALFVFGDVTLDTIYCVDGLPGGGECRIIRGAKTFFGGRGANIAVAASKLGMKVALCSIAGEDFHTSGYSAQLKKHKVNTENLKVIEQVRISRFYLYENQKGESCAFYEPRVDKYYDTLDFDVSKLEDYGMVHFTSMHEKFAVKMLRKLRHTNKIVSASLGKEIYMVSASYLRLLLETCEYIFMNEAEARELKVKVKELFPDGKENSLVIVITSGIAGSVIQTRDAMIKIPTVKARKATNPIGAGDAYVAGFLYGISKKYDLQTCGRIASVVASFAIEGYGAQSSLPDFDRVKRRYLDTFGAAIRQLF